MFSIPPVFFLALFAAVVSLLALFAVILAFHFHRYAIPGDRSPFIQLVFLAGNVFFFLIALTALFAVPWDNLSQ